MRNDITKQDEEMILNYKKRLISSLDSKLKSIKVQYKNLDIYSLRSLMNIEDVLITANPVKQNTKEIIQRLLNRQ